jgi:hypothetical protein
LSVLRAFRKIRPTTVRARGGCVFPLSTLAVCILGVVTTLVCEAPVLAVDDYHHYTTIGQVGLTVTNYGVIGQGYTKTPAPQQPSCLYKLHSERASERIEHFSFAGLWIGAKKGGQKLVSTGIVDGVFDYGEEGLEFTTTENPADTVLERSSIRTSPKFDVDAVSQQDFLCDFTDANTVVPGGGPIPNHTPLGINVHMETYAWNYSFADAFVILNYTITNISAGPLDELRIGYWVDASVANMNYLNNYDQQRQMGYQYDSDGDDGFAQSYLGVQILGCTLPQADYSAHYHQWQWNTASSQTFPDYVMPRDDEERYDALGTTHPYGADPQQGGIPDQEGSWMILVALATKPGFSLAPGEQFNAVFAVVCGHGAGAWVEGPSGNTAERRGNLSLNADWALRAYNGEDANGNGVLDEGEDLDGDGELDRYVLPAPPPSPRLKLVPGRGMVTLWWDDSPESAEDPVSREVDFEGYRIYGAKKTAGSEGDFTLLAQYDLLNDVGYNTGLDGIRADTTIDSVQYHYRYVNEQLLSGWPGKNYFSVTSYDKGDPANNLESLESSPYENKANAFPGSQPAPGLKVTVYPNPYRAQAAWDGQGERERMLWFRNLPARAEIRVFTLSGDLVDVVQHDAATYDGTDIQRLEPRAGETGDRAFSGGEHAWDLITKDDQAIATGLYLFSVEDLDTGATCLGRFLVIK